MCSKWNKINGFQHSRSAILIYNLKSNNSGQASERKRAKNYLGIKELLFEVFLYQNFRYEGNINDNANKNYVTQSFFQTGLDQVWFVLYLFIFWARHVADQLQLVGFQYGRFRSASVSQYLGQRLYYIVVSVCVCVYVCLWDQYMIAIVIQHFDQAQSSAFDQTLVACFTFIIIQSQVNHCE